ncbi:MAG TPA: YbhB/YbcL family Raf kinase inhibitor-like protein [Candidatus Dormibacteraeota bacterium]|nr:YbhB/YbcL family Raf kinase inhibitor-like protein [Candidatus Dormibacteraeota bacterium]
MRKILVRAMTILMIAGVASGLAAQPSPQGGRRPAGPPPPLILQSNDVFDGAMIATKFTCAAGADAVSPELHWIQPPRGTVSFTLILHDMEPHPRKGIDDILHWMVWNLPATASLLPEDVSHATGDLPDGSHQTNGFVGRNGNFGYLPPCPPQNVSVPHHYAFELFALDQKLDLPANATRADVMKAMDGHIIGHSSIVAHFNR